MGNENQAMINGKTPLYVACQAGHLRLANFLCETGAEKDQAMNGGKTPLYIASQVGHLDVVRLLCDAGADRSQTKNSRRNPLRVASQMGHFDVVRFLSGGKLDADVNGEVDGECSTLYGDCSTRVSTSCSSRS